MSVNFRHVRVTPYEEPVQFNRYDQPLIRACAWCSRDATHHISRESVLTGNQYEDLVCKDHAQAWLAVSEHVQLGFDV